VANPNPAAKSKRNLLWVSTSYFGEGLPWSFLHQMATEFLTAIKASNTMIGSTSLLHLSVTLKLLWSPIVDLFGRKRTWMWMMQVILGLGMFVVAAVAPTGNLTAFWTVIVVLSVLHATHDIACDGFYMQALDRKDQARFSGVRMAAFHVARLVGSSLLVFLAGRTNWMLGFGAAGVLMILTGLTNRAIAPHPPEHHPQDDIPIVAADEGKARRRAFWDAYKTFFTQEGAALVIAFLFLYRLGDIMMFAMSKPLLRDLGVSTAQRGIVNGFSMGANIAGSLVGAAIVARRGLERWLIPMTYIQNGAISFYIGLAVFKPSLYGIIPVVIVEQFVAGAGAAAMAVFQMQRCRRAFSASHFAFATVVVSLASTLSGFASGPLNDRFGHPMFFTIAFFCSVPALILVWFVPKTPIEAAEPEAAGATKAG
jgi:PAT family beta-lactamase induction signal transducer AmpG